MKEDALTRAVGLGVSYRPRYTVEGDAEELAPVYLSVCKRRRGTEGSVVDDVLRYYLDAREVFGELGVHVGGATDHGDGNPWDVTHGRVFRPRVIKTLPVRGENVKNTTPMGISPKTFKFVIFRVVIFLTGFKLPIFDYHQY